MKAPALPLLLLALLCGCAPAAAPPDARSILTREMLDQVATPLVLVELPDTGQQATLVPTATHGQIVTWRTADRVSLSLDDGLLTATRGFGFDRMTTDLDARKTHLRAAPLDTYYTVHHSMLVEDNRTRFDSFQCRITGRVPETVTLIGQTHATRRIDEQCVSPGVEIRNSYWVSDDGMMWKSRQWISAETGYAIIERLVR